MVSTTKLNGCGTEQFRMAVKARHHTDFVLVFVHFPLRQNRIQSRCLDQLFELSSLFQSRSLVQRHAHHLLNTYEETFNVVQRMFVCMFRICR